MTETISITLDSEDKKIFEEFSGMNFIEGVKILINSIKYGGKLEFDPFWSDEHMEERKRRVADSKNGRNMHEHDLIEV